jgi:hypothetical protein
MVELPSATSGPFTEGNSARMVVRLGERGEANVDVSSKKRNNNASPSLMVLKSRIWALYLECHKDSRVTSIVRVWRATSRRSRWSSVAPSSTVALVAASPNRNTSILFFNPFKNVGSTYRPWFKSVSKRLISLPRMDTLRRRLGEGGANRGSLFLDNPNRTAASYKNSSNNALASCGFMNLLALVGIVIN